MTNDETPNDEGMTNSEARISGHFVALVLQQRLTTFDIRHSDFFRHSTFVIRHSSFDIQELRRSLSNDLAL